MKCGIATHYCTSDKLAELEKELLICNCDNDIEKILNKFCPVDDSPFVLDNYLKQINEHFSASTVEGIIKNLQSDKSEWAQKTLAVG